MSTETLEIRVSDLNVKVEKKKIRNLHISVHPPDGRVKVAAPLHMTEDSIRLAIVSKLTRIRREISEFKGYVRESQKEMVSGESHYVEGNHYLLDMIEIDAPPSVTIRNSRKLELRVRPNSRRDKRESVMNDWLRERMCRRIGEILPIWEERTGVNVEFCGIKRMKTKWGSCNPATRRVWLNLELARKPSNCLEYVLVHEMAHILEPTHNDRFFEIMDEFMPTWKTHRDALDEPPLVHAEWEY